MRTAAVAPASCKTSLDTASGDETRLEEKEGIRNAGGERWRVRKGRIRGCLSSPEREETRAVVVIQLRRVRARRPMVAITQPQAGGDGK